MNRSLTLSNRHRAHPVDLRRFRRLLLTLLEELCGLNQFDLGFCLLNERQMTQLNETFLRHAGSTDVITFDYSSPASKAVQTASLHGDIYICLDETVLQARRFHTSWPAELTRYAVHGVLHLRGFDDLQPGPRRQMKREENRLLRRLTRQFDLNQLAPPRTPSQPPTPLRSE